MNVNKIMKECGRISFPISLNYKMLPTTCTIRAAILPLRFMYPHGHHTPDGCSTHFFSDFKWEKSRDLQNF